MDGDVHVLPVNDRCGHIESEFCPCEPEVEEYGDCKVYIHHAYDHRELFEDLEKWLGDEYHG